MGVDVARFGDDRSVIFLRRGRDARSWPIEKHHGLGLMSVYMHLSKIEVTVGRRVRRGQIIALSGASGRATGPHLHLGVRWQGTYIDPAKLFELQIPTAH